MDKFIVDSSHFSGVLRAIAWLQENKYTGETKLVCDEEEEIYVLLTSDTGKTLTELSY